MEIQDFDEKFRELYTGMVEIAFEFVNYNAAEVNSIYVFGSMGSGSFFYKAFYSINGEIVGMHHINTVSKQQYDVSNERQIGLLKVGVKYLKDIATLFQGDRREIPTLMKMIYKPQTGEFNNDISYEDHYLIDPEKATSDVYTEWFDKIKRE